MNATEKKFIDFLGYTFQRFNEYGYQKFLLNCKDLGTTWSLSDAYLFAQEHAQQSTNTLQKYGEMIKTFTYQISKPYVYEDKTFDTLGELLFHIVYTGWRLSNGI